MFCCVPPCMFCCVASLCVLCCCGVQVANAKVLVPTTGLVDAAAIAAARDLRLIAQPAAGYANIDIEAAKQRSIPVTIAPGRWLCGIKRIRWLAGMHIAR
eukprot:GHRQ01022685.1.p4 GENE.GHRQ01022685.1~~GHRQ01022685.1.p4  ORF type:complete len:100 (-),score=32.39 GHRQ01022685.1:1100-1399(-)